MYFHENFIETDELTHEISVKFLSQPSMPTSVTGSASSSGDNRLEVVPATSGDPQSNIGNPEPLSGACMFVDGVYIP
jgi:hypothetical protein